MSRPWRQEFEARHRDLGNPERELTGGLGRGRLVHPSPRRPRHTRRRYDGVADRPADHPDRVVLDEIAGDPAAMPAVEDRMRLVNRLADRNRREGTGGPFAAVA